MREFRSTLISVTNISCALALLLFPARPSHGQDLSETGAGAYKRQIIRNVVLEGVKSFDQSEIKSLLYSKPNHWYILINKRRLSRSNVQFDAAIIERFYKRRGFLFVSVADSVGIGKDNKATIVFRVDEGKKTILSGVGVDGGLEPINRKFDKTLAQFVIGEPVDAGLVISSRFILRDHYFDNSHPYAKIGSRYDFNGDSSAASIRYEVAESLVTINGETSPAKTGLTRPDIILRELAYKPGEPYNRQDLIESERRILSTGLFKYLSIARDDTSAVIRNDTCNVGFKLNFEERKPFFLNGGVGVGREEDFDMVFRVSVQWGNRNILGTGRRMFLSVRPSFQMLDSQGPLKSLRFSDLRRKLKFNGIRNTVEMNYVEPWFLGWRIPAALKLTYEPHTLNVRIRDFAYRYDRFAGEAFLLYELDKFTTARFSSAAEYINIMDVPADQQEAFRAEGDNQIRRKVSIYGERDTRDNIFIPQRGSYSFFGMDYVGNLLGGDFNYFKAQFSWSRYRILIGENIVATRLWFGWLDDMGKNGRSSAEDRFMLGGATTIRGYSQNSLGPVFTVADNPGDKLGKPKGGRYLMLGNIELRRPLFWRFGGSVFVDAGNTYSNFDYITPLSAAFSSGLGIQFFTPIGPIRFDYGVRLKKELDLGAGNLHLAILYAF